MSCGTLAPILTLPLTGHCTGTLRVPVVGDNDDDGHISEFAFKFLPIAALAYDIYIDVCYIYYIRTVLYRPRVHNGILMNATVLFVCPETFYGAENYNASD